MGVSISDPDLTETGKRQATLVGERLRGEGIELLLCSPLRRSLETAEIISRSIEIDAIVRPEIMESWDGSDALPASRVKEIYPNFKVEMPERWWPGPESEKDLYSRASRAEKMLRDLGEASERRVVAVSHGSFGAVLLSTFLGAPPCGYTRFSQHNCCISILDIKPERAKLYRGNDVSHLPDEMLT
jgi:probable phosphoglycerate mutase